MIFSQIGKFPALLALACLVTLGASQPVRAYSAEEYVLPTDCAAEQQAYQGSIPVKRVLEHPWIYKVSGSGARRGPDNYRRTAAELDSMVKGVVRGVANYDDEYRLQACAYRKAAERMEANFRKVTGGLPVKSLVSQGDCQAEQAALVAAYIAEPVFRNYASQTGRDVGDQARATVAEAISEVTYNYYTFIRGKRMDRQNLLAVAEYSAPNPTYDAGKTQMTLAYARLSACLYQTAADRVGGDSGDRPLTQGGASAGPEVVTCAAEPLREMNLKIADIDSRLDTFLKTSEYANGTGDKGASPMLTVTLWALKGQADAIRKYCPDVEAHKRRIETLEISLRSAQAACDQIQAGGATCKPAEPETLQ